MWFDLRKKRVQDRLVTPQDYSLALREGRYKETVAEEIEEAEEQAEAFRKRENDLRIIAYRNF